MMTTNPGFPESSNPASAARTGATRAVVPASVRAHRRMRVVAPLSALALSAVALTGAVLPSVMSVEPAAAMPGAAAKADLAQAVSQRLVVGQPAKDAGATTAPGATSAPTPAAPAARPVVEADTTSVVVATPTPTPTPTAATASSSKASGESGTAASSGGGSSEPVAAVVPAGEAQQIAHDMVLARGWGEGEFSCLVKLWDKESGWNVTAENSSSGAYGIPQAYPGSKMASAGADWRSSASTQITWGLGYVSGRYGSPCDAWSYWQSNGSY